MKKIINEIAIVGMSCRFPKSNNLSEYWNNICLGRECLTKFDQAMSKKMDFDEKKDSNYYVPVKGILEGIEKFDAGFFGFNPSDAQMLDPQQRLFLQCVWEALEHSGNIPSKIKDAVSVFAGMADSNYLQQNLLKNRQFLSNNDWFQARIATSIGALSTQVSYRLNLTGNSINVNTACSTGLVAVSQACQDLTLGNSRLAIAGAISLNLPQDMGYYYRPDDINSPDGHCRPFAHNAGGTVFSSGVGVVILKNLQDALMDNDTIYAVIKSCGINNDGADKIGYVAPSINGQSACIDAALSQAKLSAADIGFVETHGTATNLGDIVEFTALKKVYEKYTTKKQYCILGSVKGNIGHTDIASGIAGLIKVACCLYYKKIPPMLHYRQSNSRINFAESPFYINKKLISWSDESSPRYAAVSAFGVGGTNAHLILRDQQQTISDFTRDKSALIVVSAKNKTALAKNSDKLAQYIRDEIKDTTSCQFKDMAYTLQTGREEFSHRSFVVSNNLDQIIGSLNQKNYIALRDNTDSSAIVFMFPGQGSQYYEMAVELMHSNALFSKLLKDCSDIAKKQVQFNIYSFLYEKDASKIYHTQYAQLAIFMIEYALAKLLITCGVKPKALMGHSMGEYTAACIAGVFSFKTAIFLVHERGRLMSDTAEGAMLAVACNAKDLLKFKRNYLIDVAAHNTPTQYVLAGSVEEINKLQQNLMSQKIACQKLKTYHAFHSFAMKTIESKFLTILRKIKLYPPKLTVISNVTGIPLTNTQAIDAHYWCKHLRSTVKFNGSIEWLFNDGYNVFLEVGPGHTLTNFVKEITKHHHCQIVAVNTLPNAKKRVSDQHQLWYAFGLLWQNGLKVDWNKLYSHEKRKKIALPTYSFQEKRYWVEPNVNEYFPEIKQSIEDYCYQPSWIRHSAVKDLPVITRAINNYCWIFFNDQSPFSQCLIDILRRHQAQFICIKIATSFNKIDDENYSINPGSKSHYEKLFFSLKRMSRLPFHIIHLFSLDNTKKAISDHDLNKNLDKSFYSVLYITQSIIQQIGGKDSVYFSIVTCGSQSVLGTETLVPVNATLVGACRVVPQEHPSFNFQLIDLDNFEKEKEHKALSIAIMGQCVSNDCDTNGAIKVFRNGYLWRPHYVPIKLNSNVCRFKHRGVYLITGGLGGISLTLCEAIARQVHQVVFILLSRTLFPPDSQWETLLADSKQAKWHKKINSIITLKTLGANIQIKQADVTKVDEFESAVKQTIVDYGGINGVIHAAGIPGGGLVQLKNKKSTHKVIAPKVHGTYHLARIFNNISLDFIVLFSSVSALVGEIGQTDYCAANACLDVFAAGNFFKAQQVISINWNTWKEVGMAVETERPKDIAFLDYGNDITPDEGRKLFMNIMKSNYSQVVISKYDILALPRITKQHKESLAQMDIDTSREDLNLKASYEAPATAVQRELIRLWCDVLGIIDIGINDDFFDLGGHSLTALQLLSLINEKYHTELSLQDLYDTSTIEKLAIRIKSCIKKTFANIAIRLYQGEKKSHPFFLCHPISGMTFCYKEFVSHWKGINTLYGLQDPSISTGRIEYNTIIEMAKSYLKAIKKIQPTGPYHLIGYSMGGTIVYEIAHLLRQQSDCIGCLVLIDGWAVFSQEQQDEHLFKKNMHQYHCDLTKEMVDLAWQRMQILLLHKPSQSHQKMMLFKAQQLIREYDPINRPDNGWSLFNTGNIKCYPIQANHVTIMDAKPIEIVLKFLFDTIVNVKSDSQEVGSANESS